MNRTRRGFDAGDRENAVARLVTRKESAQSIADGIGVKRATLYDWKRKLLGEEAPSQMPRKKRDMTIEEPGRMRAAPGADIDGHELKRAVLEGTVELLGKGQGADPGMPADREKTIPVESLGPAHRLKDLLEAAGSAKASHRYQVRALAKPDKYAGLRIRICEIFHDSCGRYGHRRARSVSRAEGATVSEKVACRITAEEDLKACRPKRRRYSPYEGEISAAPENPVDRDLRADAPGEIRLAGIAGLSIPAGKVYLSPIIDCLDGKVAAGAMSAPPNAGPVNAVPGDAAATLKEGEPPRRPQRPGPPLPLARMGRGVRALRDNQVDVEEGVQPGQLGDGGALRAPQGGVLLRPGPEGLVDRAVHGGTGRIHRLVQREAHQGIIGRDESRPIQDVAGTRSIGRFGLEKRQRPPPQRPSSPQTPHLASSQLMHALFDVPGPHIWAETSKSPRKARRQRF